MRAEFAQARVRVDGMPILGVAIENLRQDVIMLRAAISDMARVDITAGEVEALHTEINRMMSRGRIGSSLLQDFRFLKGK